MLFWPDSGAPFLKTPKFQACDSGNRAIRDSGFCAYKEGLDVVRLCVCYLEEDDDESYDDEAHGVRLEEAAAAAAVPVVPMGGAAEDS